MQEREREKEEGIVKSGYTEDTDCRPTKDQKG